MVKQIKSPQNTMLQWIVYSQLVRDNIPDITISKNVIPVTRILSDSEYSLELSKKLVEKTKKF